MYRLAILLAAISSPTARFTGAAGDGDKKAIQARLKERKDVNIRDWEELNDFTVASGSKKLLNSHSDILLHFATVHTGMYADFSLLITDCGLRHSDC